MLGYDILRYRSVVQKTASAAEYFRLLIRMHKTHMRRDMGVDQAEIHKDTAHTHKPHR